MILDFMILCFCKNVLSLSHCPVWFIQTVHGRKVYRRFQNCTVCYLALRFFPFSFFAFPLFQQTANVYVSTFSIL